MSAFKEIYDILKDLKNEAKRLQSQEMISLSMDVQEKLFDLRDEMEGVKAENKLLKEEIEKMKKPIISEDDIKYTKNGFFTLKSENNEIPYCSACWKTSKKIVPLSKGTKAWYHYSCSNCKVDISIMDSYGNDLLKRK